MDSTRRTRPGITTTAASVGRSSRSRLPATTSARVTARPTRPTGSAATADFSAARATARAEWGESRGPSFVRARLLRADFSYSELGLADFSEADLALADLRNASLGSAVGLTQDQVSAACADGSTILPSGITAHWTARCDGLHPAD
ncbi:MAG: hypothetical protein FJ144_27200 [Deltaproteobacteria bacterium]|nr:hypothetical protein [Deltaproteobacteria bacterium]